jgi:hypothetical protein
MLYEFIKEVPPGYELVAKVTKREFDIDPFCHCAGKECGGGCLDLRKSDGDICSITGLHGFIQASLENDKDGNPLYWICRELSRIEGE